MRNIIASDHSAAPRTWWTALIDWLGSCRPMSLILGGTVVIAVVVAVSGALGA